MNIKDLDLSDYVIKTSKEYEDFKKDVKNVFSQIEQNYSDDNYLLVNFILGIERVYKEHPEVDKILLDYEQDTYHIDGIHYNHNISFSVKNSENNKDLKSASVNALTNFIMDFYGEKANSSATDLDYGKDLWNKCCDELFLEEFNKTSQKDRFKIYNNIASFAYFNNEEPFLKIIDCLKQNVKINDENKTVKFLGQDIEMQIINIKDNHFSLNGNESDIDKIRKRLIDIETSYVVSQIKEEIKKNNLNTNDKIFISFEKKKKDGFKDYALEIIDSDDNSIELNMSFVFNKFLPNKTYFKYDDLNNSLISALSRNGRSEQVKESFDNDELKRENNYTDVNRFIRGRKPF